MTNRFEQLATRIFETLKGYGYTLNVYDEEGNKIFVPRNGRAFFSQNEELAVYIFENGIDSDIKIFLSGEVDPFLKLLKNLRKTAIKYRVNFTVRKYGGSIRPKDFAFMAADIVSEGSDSMEYKLDEGMTGTSRTSYQKIGETRIVIKHTAPVKEAHGSRGRNIKAIFIETPEGERLKYPYNHLLGARAMARHINSEGSMRDPFGERIIGLSEDIRDLTKIGNYIWQTRTELDESSLEFRLVAREKISSYKKTLESLCRPRGYETTKSILEEDDTEKLPDQNAMDKMREMLKLEENDEFDQALAKLAVIVKEANDPIDLEAPGEPASRGFTDMEAGEADDYIEKMRQGKGLSSEEVEATGDRNAKIIRNAMGFTASGDFANIKMDELRATAADPIVPGAERWAEYKPHWDTIIKNGAPWGDPSTDDWQRLKEMQGWVESLNTNLVGSDIKNIVLGAILIRISSALHTVMDRTLPAFDIIGVPFQKYLVPFFDLISGETVMETKTTGMPEEEQLNDWFDSFDPNRFLAGRKSQYAKTVTKKTEIIKESVKGDEVETESTKRKSLSENQIWIAANKLVHDSENKRLVKNYYNSFTADDFQKVMETVRDTFNEDLARKVIEDARRILKKKVTESQLKETIDYDYFNWTEQQFINLVKAGQTYLRANGVDLESGEGYEEFFMDLNRQGRGEEANALEMIAEPDLYQNAQSLKQNANYQQSADKIGLLIDVINFTPEVNQEMDEIHQGEESGIVIKHDAHNSLIDDIEFDADDPSEIPFKDELVDDMYLETSRASDIRHILNQIENI